MLVVALATALTVAAGAEIWPPQLVGSFAAPPGAIDVAFEWGPLRVLVGGTTPTVYELTTNGSVTASFRVPVGSGARGIAYDRYTNNWMWVSNRLNGYIYRLTTAGSLLASFRCPAGPPYGLGHTMYNPRHGRGLFAACREINLVARLDPTTGSLLATFAGPAGAVVAFDDFFAADRNSKNLYWDYYGSWQVLDQLPARPYGVGARIDWPTDVWVELYVLCTNGYIYKYYGVTAVAPGSLGRVKALFR
jgi:DNA-binding beta-propeller fold protein YncE